MSAQILVGDALAALRTLPDASADAMVCSPPAYNQRRYLPRDHPASRHEIGHEENPEGYIAALVAVFREARRVLKPRSACWVNLGDTYYSGCGQGGGLDPRFPVRNWMREEVRAVDRRDGWDVPRKSQLLLPQRVALAMQADGWVLRRDVVWHAANAPQEPSARDRPWRRHEPLFLFSTRPYGYHFDREALGGEESVWEIPLKRQTGPGNGGHGAAMPYALAERCVLSCARRGQTVLVPFSGTGTVALACMLNGRRSVNIELSDAHADFSRVRLEAEAALARRAA